MALVNQICILLQSELKTLQELGAALAPANDEKNKPVRDQPILKQQIEYECKRVKDAITKAVFSPARDNLIERYIQYHQTGIIELANQLSHNLNDKDEPQLSPIVQFFISQLFDLLNYIERFFSKYFCPDARIPESYRQIALTELSAPIDLVLSLIESRVDAEFLKQCLFDYLRSFNNEKFPAAINFGDLIYLKSFLSEIEQFFMLNETGEPDLKLSETLIYLNFNHLGFFTYCQESIRHEMENSESKEQCIEILSRSLSQVKGLQSKPSVSYHSAWPNIKTMLETWLSDEIAIAILRPSKSSQALISESPIPNEKITYNLSVAQIACFIRLFYEEGCYSTGNITEILKFTVRHFRSKRQEQISTGSLSKEYYGISQVTAAVVRDILTRMIQRINKNYFPVWVAVYAACYSSSITW